MSYKTSPHKFFKRLYHALSARSKQRNHALPDFSYDEFVEWLENQPNLTKLWYEYQKSNHNRMLAPSVDRKNNDFGYYFDNMTLGTWQENRDNASDHHTNGLININTVSSSKPVKQMTMKGELVMIHPSAASAGRQLSKNPTGIRNACTGAKKSAYGYLWA